MRRTRSLLLPSVPTRRRNRVVATLTIAVGAVTIAATTSGTGEVLTPTGAATTADAGVTRAVTTQVPAALEPATERAVTTPAIPAGSRIGTIERLAQHQQLPSLDAAEITPRVGGVQADGPDGAAADQAAEADQPLAYTAVDGEVITPARIFAFLDGRNAPLAEHAETFVEAGVAHDVDPRVVVAIAIAESDAGKMHPEGTYNAWGWGGSGGPRGLRAWDSWEQSIDQYTERLGELYDTDDVDWDFASTYCPPNTQWWFDTVTWAMRQI